jgi:hypothetical protein
MFSNEISKLQSCSEQQAHIKMCKCIQAYEYKWYFDAIVQSSNSNPTEQIFHIFMAML